MLAQKDDGKAVWPVLATLARTCRLQKGGCFLTDTVALSAGKVNFTENQVVD